MKHDERVLYNSEGLPYVSIYFDDVLQATTDIWTGAFETEENMKEGLRLVLKNILKYNSKKWLADLSQIEGDFSFAQEFIAHEVVPQAMGYGLRFEALVIPNSIISMLSVQETMQIFNHLELRMFATYDAAKEWLDSKG
jgi:hypothetical protein